MTVSYAGEVPNGSSFGCFWKILWKWRGSVYKLVWRELFAYLALYYTINVLYRHVLTDDQKRVFEKIRQYFGAQSESIPMSFVLGFYVSLIVKRWWEQYKLLPWPDTLALFISAAIPGNNETGRLMRRNIMRYAVLAYVITLMRISLRVKRRFPTWQHLVDAGLMLESEKKIFEIMDGKSPMSKYWMPLVWATNIINRARKQEIIASDHIVQTLLVELSDIRRRLGALIGYDTVCVPLVYTQVVTLVLYTYFIAALLGRQMIPKVEGAPVGGKYEDPDLYFPLFTALQFCFYVGWLKVAEVLINPFGEDDDDIELNWLIDRHIKASYMIVDEMHEEHPELLKDQYWEEVVPAELPYTVASEHYRRSEPKGSAENYKIKTADAMYANIIPSRKSNFEDIYADYESVDNSPVAGRRKSSHNWIRHIPGMGSVRSSSTAYSSKGNRHNSVYSSSETAEVGGQQQLGPPPANSKPRFYDRFNRKSSRKQLALFKRESKSSLNGMLLTGAPPKNRPRIPTPDVPSTDIATITSTSGATVANGVTIVPGNLPGTNLGAGLNGNNAPVVTTLILTPIKEQDSGSAHNTMHAGNPATQALASTVFSTQLQPNTDWRTALTNSPSLARIQFPTVSGGAPVVVIPNTMVTTSNITSDLLSSSIAQSQGITAISTTLPVTSMSDYIMRSASPSNIIITDVSDDHRQSSADELDLDDDLKPTQLNRRNSMSAMSAKAELTRQLSDSSKSNASPSLRKRNQPITSSAPSTLSKTKPEEKAGEVFV